MTGEPALMLLTGIGASLSRSAPFEDALNQYGVQTIAVDAPGTGDSTRYRRPRRMPGLAASPTPAVPAVSPARSLGTALDGAAG